MDNVLAATRFLTNAPIQGDTPADRAARESVAFLKTAITQQAQYSQGVPYIHGTQYQSMSRQAESPDPAASSSHRHHGAQPPLNPQGALRIMDLPAPNINRRIESVVKIPSRDQNTEFVTRSVGNRCL